MKNKLISTPKSMSRVKRGIGSATTAFDPLVVLARAEKELTKSELPVDPSSNLFKAVTLFEFENGLLITEAVSERYKTFVISLSRQFQKEFNCKNASEKAIAELAAISYIRTIEVQRMIKNYLDQNSNTGIGIQFLALLSKELDRANRHFLMAVQALRMTKQQTMHVNVRTQTAVIGQNQIVQSNNQ